MLTERKIEEKLRKAVRNKSGACLKFVSPGTNGMPDRIIFMPDGKIHFVETKSKTGKPEPHQLSIHRMLETFGQKVWIVHNEETLKRFLDAI